MEKFYLYLQQQPKKFLKKTTIQELYNTFLKQTQENKPFNKTFDALRKTRLTYLFDGYWALTKENPLLLIHQFLTEQQIPHYYGLQTALYLNKITWQAPKKYYMINTEHTRKRTIDNTHIQLTKFKKELINQHSIQQEQLPYSDKEKTLLDILYYQKKYTYIEDIDFDKIRLYLPLYPAEVKAQLTENLSREQRRKL